MKRSLSRILVGAIITGIYIATTIMTVFAADLKLNPDILKGVDSEYIQLVRADEIFIGLDNRDFTLNEFYQSMEKYGLDVKKTADEVSCGAYIGTFFVGVCWAEWSENAYDTGDLPIPHDIICEICCKYELYDWETQTSTSYSAADRDAIIERIEYINNGGELSVPIQKSGWNFEDGAWRFYENGVKIVGWEVIDGHWYYFKPDTSMVHSGFESIEGKTYHFSTEGWLDIGWQFINREGIDSWYYFNSNGEMITGWEKIDECWYYFQPDGTLTHSRLETMPDGTMYYFNADGMMLMNTDITIDGVDYIIDSTGIVTPKIP